MGFLGRIAIGAAKAVAAPVAYRATGAISDAIAAKAESRNQELMDKHPDQLKLRVKQRPYTVREQFNVFDENDLVKYAVRGSFLSPKPVLTVSDALGNRLGSVKQKLVSVRSPLELTTRKPVDFKIEVNGVELGRFRTKAYGRRYDFEFHSLEEMKLLYELDFKQWTVWNKRITSVNHYEIRDSSGQVIAEIESNLWSMGDCYVIYYSDEEDELLFLMMLLAIDAAADDSTMRERVSDSYHHGRYYDEQA